MLKIPTGGKGGICICIWNTSCVTFQRDWSGCYKCVGELPEGSLSWHVLVNLIEMPSATLGTAGRADLYRCRSPPRLITLADFDPWEGWAVEDGGVGVKVTCFVKLLREDHGDSSAPHLHELRQLCVAAQRVRRRTAIGSRLCNWHQPDVGGYTCLERGGGGAWHRRTGLPVLHGEWQEEADLAAAFHVGITACGDIETKNDFVGKFNCEFLSPFMFLLK